MGSLRCLRNLELTLAIIKPDVCRNPHDLQPLPSDRIPENIVFHNRSVRQIVLENNFLVVKTKVTQLSQSEAQKFYDEHKNRFFFNRLVTFMSSGIISIHILGRDNAIKHWRNLMGPTHVYKAQYEAPNSLRARFGLTDTRNATHGSDSPDSARREIAFFFPDFNVDEWYKHYEEAFRNNEVYFDPERWVHRVRSAKAQQLV